MDDNDAEILTFTGTPVENLSALFSKDPSFGTPASALCYPVYEIKLYKYIYLVPGALLRAVSQLLSLFRSERRHSGSVLLLYGLMHLQAMI
ncbi:MAG: hypothetical protein IPH57_06645 [Saprospiraceae bacterium]|nr:hypothetical protein [Saprospiraceae bacterium]